MTLEVIVQKKKQELEIGLNVEYMIQSIKCNNQENKGVIKKKKKILVRQ